MCKANDFKMNFLKRIAIKLKKKILFLFFFVKKRASIYALKTEGIQNYARLTFMLRIYR